MTHRPARRPWPFTGLEIALFLFFLLLYTLTLAPGLLPADAGEYQLAGATFGIAHPPGFALYTLVSGLFARLAGVSHIASPATSINWLSALLAALTLTLLYRLVVRLTALPLAGVSAALLLGASTTFWAQATTANIRMPAAAATLFALDRLLAYRQALTAADRSKHNWALAWFALALGLGVAHHGSLIFIMAVFGLYALALRPIVLRRPLPLLAGLLPFAAWLYFPLRGPAVGLPRLATLDGFLEHVLARGFSGDILFFANLTALPDRLAIFANTLTFEFTAPLLALMAVGALALLLRDRGVGALLLIAAAVHILVAITYRAPQTVEYLLPAWALLGVWAGVGLASVWEGLLAALRRAPSWAGVIGKALITLIVLVQFAATYPSYRVLAADDGTRAYAEGVLTQAPPNAVILSTWHWANPLWYLQQIEGQRPDVEVRYVVPQGASLGRTWANAINETLPTRPVVVTSFFEAEYAAAGQRFVPLGDTAAWQSLAQPLTAAPTGLQGGQDFGPWRFLGWRRDPANPGEVTVTAAWQLDGNGPPEAMSVFVHLLAPDGSLHSQQDVAYAAERYVSGEVLVDRYTLPLRPDAPAGTYTLMAGAYRPTGEVLAQTTLTTIAWPPADAGPPDALVIGVPPDAVPLGSAMWLAGWHMAPSGPLHPGDTLRVSLDFIAARPLTADYTVKLDLIGPDYGWQVASDGTPAGGAIPTLKWIAGSRVTDVHTFVIPAGAAPGPAQLALAVYDAFTQRTLAILSPELAALGPTIALGTVEVAPAPTP